MLSWLCCRDLSHIVADAVLFLLTDDKAFLAYHDAAPRPYANMLDCSRAIYQFQRMTIPEQNGLAFEQAIFILDSTPPFSFHRLSPLTPWQLIYAQNHPGVCFLTLQTVFKILEKFGISRLLRLVVAPLASLYQETYSTIY